MMATLTALFSAAVGFSIYAPKTTWVTSPIGPSWQHMWPKIARCFDLEAADPVPTPLATYMADKGPLWERMTAKYGLQPIRYADLVSWSFGDFIFNSGFDNISSTIKARRAGFHACIDTEDMFAAFFENLRAEQIIPPLD